MSNSKHTPGPWVAMTEETDKNYIRIRGTIVGYHYKIANVPFVDWGEYNPPPKSELDVARANARLIAAAPELLEALESVLHHIPVSDADGMWKARAAIAKVTGVS